MTHRAATEINGETWTFTVDSPSKGQWVARAWRDGGFAMYREDRTMKGAKGQAQEHANYAATQTCAECKAVGGHTRACDAGRHAAMQKSAERGERIGLRAEVTEVQDSAVIVPKDEVAEILDSPAAEWNEAAWQAEWDRRPEGADVSDLIEITPILDSPAAGALTPAILDQLDVSQAQQLMAELEETFPHLSEWKRDVLGKQMRLVGEQLGRATEAMAAMGPAVVSASDAMAAAVARVQAARDRVQLRKDTCGCLTPLHTMRCGVGGRARVIRSAVAL